jgi:hypothetical protein
MGKTTNITSFVVRGKHEFLDIRFFQEEACVAVVNLPKALALELGLALRDEAQK